MLYRALLTSLMFVTAAPAFGESSYNLDVNDLFVPEGFDDNDNVQIVLDGYKKSSCDKELKPEVEINYETLTIYVQPRAEYGMGECMPVVTRYTTVAELGQLPYGNYEVITNNGWLVHHFEVLEASNAGPSDDNFANVEHIDIDYAPDSELYDTKISLVLRGYFVDSCETWDEIKVKPQANQFVVMPLTKRVGENCASITVPFTVRVPLEEQFEEMRYLAHVKSKYGITLNEVFTGIPE